MKNFTKTLFVLLLFLFTTEGMYAQTIISENTGFRFTNFGLQCDPAEFTTSREFVLNEHGVNTEFVINGAQVGFDQNFNSGEFTLTYNVYSVNQAYPDGWPASRTLLTSQVATYDNDDFQTLKEVTFDTPVTVQPTDRIVLEVVKPDTVMGVFDSSASETGPDYLTASCGIPDPLESTSVGFPDYNVVANLKGEVLNFTDVSQTERDALVDFYISTNGDAWFDNLNWNTASPVSTWRGVTVENGVVTHLRLSSNNLSGELSLTLPDLTSLESFEILFNSVGGLLPENIGTMTSLTVFSILSNNFEGTVPASLSNLTNLELLQIQQNGFSGDLPDFTGATNLSFFNMRSNDFVFSDFEDEFPQYQANVATYIYSPQERTEEPETRVANFGDELTFTAADLGTDVTYQWYKGDTPIDGETNASITVSINNVNDLTEYYYIATSSIVTGLELEREHIIVGRDPLGHPDYDALVAFYNATDGDNWIDNSGWLDPEVPISAWTGITEIQGRVRVIEFNNNNLLPVIPDEIGDLTALNVLSIVEPTLDFNRQGSLSPEITTLSNLQTLRLENLFITDGLPDSIGNLNSLLQLQIIGCQLQGELPASITSMTALQTLDLRSNFMVGQLPDNLGDLSNLQFLDLRFNGFDGQIPTSLTNITGLQWALFTQNQLSGEVPDLSVIPTMNFYWIDGNLFEFGDIEPNFAANTTIQSFDYFVQFTDLGPISGKSAAIGETVTLEAFIMSGANNFYEWYKDGILIDNESGQTIDVTVNSVDDYGNYSYIIKNSVVNNLEFEGPDIVLGEGPEGHPDYDALLAFFNSTNGPNWNNPWDITAPIEAWDVPGNLDFDPVTDRVTNITLNNRGLTGTIPPEIGDLTELNTLFLFQNNITGDIPDELWTLSNMETLIIGAQQDRMLTLPGGAIPAAISNMTDLFWLNLTQVPISQPLPQELFELASLERLRLADCGITGQLPEGLGNIDNIIMSGNDLEGPIPSDIINSTGNTQLSIFNNYYTFEDLEPLVLADNYPQLGISPQRTRFEEEDVMEEVGNNITLTLEDNNTGRSFTNENNEYQWLKDGEFIPGATAETYTIVNAQFEDNGAYTCQISNPNVPDLILVRAASNVMLEDTIAPQAIADDRTIGLDFEGNVTLDAGFIGQDSTDNSTNGLTYSLDNADYTCADIGTVMVTLTVTDSSGNSDTDTAMITIVDNLGPNANLQNLNVFLDATGNASVSVEDFDNGTTDNCSDSSEIQITTDDSLDFNCDNVIEFIDFTLIDGIGNESIGLATVTVFDNIAPTVSGTDIEVDLNGESSITVPAQDVDNGTTDNCTFTLSLSQDTFTETGEYLVQLIATDSRNNMSSSPVTITVVDRVLGVEDVDFAASIIMYPNPATTMLNISTQSQLERITIYDVSGKKVLSIDENFESIDVSKLSSGVYFASFESDLGQTQKRFVKQ